MSWLYNYITTLGGWWTNQETPLAEVIVTDPTEPVLALEWIADVTPYPVLERAVVRTCQKKGGVSITDDTLFRAIQSLKRITPNIKPAYYPPANPVVAQLDRRFGRSAGDMKEAC